jgi:YD repeat-containing protein
MPSGTAVEIVYDEMTGRQKELRLISNADSQEQLRLLTDMTYDAEGSLVSYRDARGSKYWFEFDGFGRPVAVLRPDGVRSENQRDGLDRTVQERFRDTLSRVLDERKYSYDRTGRLVKVEQHRLATELEDHINEWLVVEEIRYDPDGNVVERRGSRPEGWEKYSYDGLGRLVSKQFPNWDRQEFLYENDWLAVETHKLRYTNKQDQDLHILHTVILRDDRGLPWCTLPVGHDGTIGIGRAKLTHYDSMGNVALEVQPFATKT